MKIKNMFFYLALPLIVNFSCTAQSGEKQETGISKKEGVEVLYFHYTRRCATCNAVENVSKETLAELYGNKVNFISYNLEEETGEAKGKELGVNGQTLLIVNGSTKINITNEGFMNARSNPEKLKAVIKEKIDPLIN